MSRVEELRKQILLEGLNDEELKIIDQYLTEINIPKAKAVFVEGDNTRGIYMVKSGRIEIKRKLHLDTRTKMLVMLRNISSSEVRHTSGGWEHIFANMSAGQFFGELSVIENRKKHSGEACTVEDTVLFVLPQEAFEDLESSMPELMVKIMKVIARVSSANMRLLDKRVFKALIGH